MDETILEALRQELLTRTPLDTIPAGVWKRAGALNTWGTNAIEGNTLNRRDVERILLERRSVPIAGSRHVPPRMERVVPMLDEWIEGYAKKDLLGEDVFSTAAWMHFGFESIHPFSDGNGRVGRLLLNLHFLKHNWPPVHVLPSDKHLYLKSLDKGHGGALVELVDFLRLAIGRSLLDLLDQVGTGEDELKPLKKLARNTPYSAKYLALRASQSRLPALKLSGDWHSSERAITIYREFV